MSKMKSVVTFYGIVIVLGLAIFVSGQSNLCTIDGILDSQWISELIIPIKDIDEGITFRGATRNTNSMKVEDLSNLQNKYVNAAFTENELIISLEKIFSEYEEYETVTDIRIFLTFSCTSSTRTLIVRHIITDTNNHAPVFLPNENYNIFIFTPLAAGFPIVPIFDNIYVKDVDLTNTEIIPFIEPNEYFDFIYDGTNGTVKVHKFKLVVTKVLYGLEEPISLEISATDKDRTGDPPKTTPGSVKIDSDPMVQIPVTPSFSMPFYTGTFVDEELIFDEKIEIIHGFDNSVGLKLEGEHSVYFDHEMIENEVKIIIKTPIPEDIIQQNSFLLFSLIAIKEDTPGGKTAINIKLPRGDPQTIIRFQNAFYKYDYTEDGKLNGPDIIISEGYSDNIHFNIKGELSSHFTTNHSDGKVQLEVVDPLSDDFLKENQHILLVLDAEDINSIPANTTIIISLPPKEDISENILKFKNSFYNYTYKTDNTLFGPEIELLDDYNVDIQFDIVGDYQEYFKITKIENKKVILELNRALSQDILNANTFLVLILEAKSESLVSGTTILTVELPKNEIAFENILEFKEPFYDFTYTVDNKIIGPEIELFEEYDIELSFHLLGDTQSYFSIENQNEKLILSVKENLPESIILSNQYLTLILEVRGDNFKTGVTILTIELPSPVVQNVLKFKDPFYNLTYTENNELLEHDIILQDSADNIKFTLEGYANEYFTAESSDDKNVKLTVKENLPAQIIEENIYLILTLHATADNYDSGITIVNINLPRKEGIPGNSLKFKDQYYYYTYMANGNLAGPEIELLDDHNTDIQFGIIGDYQDHFKITVKENKKVILELKNALSQDILNANTFLVLILEAKGNSLIPGSTILTVELPKKEIILEDMLEFKAPFYNFTYTIDNKIIGPEIELFEEYDIELSFQLFGDSQSYFSIEKQNEILILSIKENLPESIILNNQYLTLILEVKGNNFKTGVTILTIELPSPVVQNVLKFKDPFYNLTYTDDNELLEHDIILQDSAEDTKFILEGYANEYFVVESSNNKNVKLTIKEQLPPQILDENFYLILVLQATADNYDSGITIININLPKKDVIATVLFDKPYYEGVYNDGNLVMADIKVNGYEDGTEFFITGNNSEYFKPKYENGKIIIENEDLPESITNTGAIIILTLDGRKSSEKIAWTTLIITVKKRTDIKVSFDSQFYYANFSTSTLGTIIRVRAVASDNSKIRYENIILDDYLRPLIEIDEDFGSISVRSFINVGHYKFQVKAMISQNEDLTTVELGVLEDGKLEIQLNPLVIVNITEHNPSDNIGVKLDLITGCTYEIENAWPVGKDWFTINQTSGSIACSNIDREDDKIAFMYVSQIQLELSCKKPPSKTARNVCLSPTAKNNDETDATGNWIFTKDIFTLNNRFITVIVNDINDHPPVFDDVNPLVGYPRGQLASILKPPFLMKVHATDKDIGLNAKIKYITESDYFTVHPESGVIYPKEEFLNQDMKFTVSARDEDGLGNKADLFISVKMIEIEHLTVIHIKKALLEDTDDILESISNKISIKLKSLMSAVLPTNEENTRNYINTKSSNRVIRFKRSEMDSDSVLTIFTYAFDENENFISSDVLMGKIESEAEGIPWSIESEKLSESSLLSGSIIYANDDGLVIAVSIISALLILLIIAVVVWFVVILPKNYYRLENDSSRGSINNSINSEYDKNSEISPDDIPSAVNRDPMISSLEAENKPEYITRDIKPNSSSVDDIDKVEISLDNKKSTVKFNETVQQIDIIEFEEEKF